MKPLPTAHTRSTLWLKLTIVLVLGVALSAGAVYGANKFYRDSLVVRAKTVASTLDASEVTVLEHPSSKKYAAEYDSLKTKMMHIKAANSGARFVYLMASDSAHNGVYFLVDSEVAGSDGYSPNGQTYPEASDRLRAMFGHAQTLVEGPVRDRWGNWLSALATIQDSVTATPVAVVGIDIPASSYETLLALAGGVPLLVTLLAMVVVFSRAKLHKRQQEAMQFRSELMSIASHELRSPLAGLRWSEELVMRAELEQTVRKAMEIMHDSTLKLQESIEDVLQLAALESGKLQQLDVHDVDMAQMLQDIFTMQQLNADQHSMRLEFANSWPTELVITCDERRIRRVFHNIISNAIKYGAPNTPVTVAYEKKTGEHIISVTDHGIGIPASEQSKVFSGFYRASNAREKSVNGTGMGLYLSRTILEQHGGSIRLDSSENSGTIVYISLPFVTSLPKTKR